MIDLELLAERINEEIGFDRFIVFTNTDVYNMDIGNRDAVVMTVSRIPMGYTQEEFDAENMTITLTFDLPVDVYGSDKETRDIALTIIAQKLLGRREWYIETGVNKGYNVTCFFELQPATAPFLDEGRVTQQITVSGSCLVQNADCNAIVGNSIKVTINGEEVLKVARSSCTQYGADNNIPLSEDKVQVELQNISKACTKTMTFIYTGKEIEKTFLKIAEGAEVDGHNVNTIYTYTVDYGIGLKLENIHFKLLSVTVLDEPGVYLKYTLSVQTVSVT